MLQTSTWKGMKFFLATLPTSLSSVGFTIPHSQKVFSKLKLRHSTVLAENADGWPKGSAIRSAGKN